MIIQKVYAQNTTVVIPGAHITSSDIVDMIKEDTSNRFYVVYPADLLDPGIMVVCKQTKIIVTSAPKATAKQIFDNKVTPRVAKRLPKEHVFYFNMLGEVTGVVHGKGLSFQDTEVIVKSAGLKLAAAPTLTNKPDFLHMLLTELLKQRTNVDAWRVGLHIGTGGFKYTSRVAIPGMVASVFSMESALRIKGVYKHAPEYAETVFWYELKRASQSIYDLLDQIDITTTFMRNLNTCL